MDPHDGKRRTFVSGAKLKTKNLRKTQGELKIQVTLNNEQGKEMRNSLNGVFGRSDDRFARCLKKVNGLKSWNVWAGYALPSEDSAFHRKRTFMSEWQSANFNGGVFLNK